MKLEVILQNGTRLIINDACEHDLVMIHGVLSRYHRRWLLKRKQHVVEINSSSEPVVICTKDIVSARML